MSQLRKSDAPPVTALAAALTLLARRPRTEAEMRQALARKGFSGEETASAVERCRELGYLNDAQYAQTHARDLARLRGLGNFAVAGRLGRKGVSRDLICQTVESLENSGDIPSEKERAANLFRKRFPNGVVGRKERERAARFLRARGFGWTLVADILGSEEEVAASEFSD